MKPLKFPSWRDIGLPDAIPDSLRKIKYGDLLNFLLGYKVFLQENKVNYLYLCKTCSHQKRNVTPFENYAECRQCGSQSLHAIPYHTLSRKNSKVFHKSFISIVCSRMAYYHDAYLGNPCPDVMEMSWDTGKSEFAAKFTGGDEVHANDPILATARAAICCPFLWDGRFDFNERKWKEQSDSFSLSHTIYQFCATKQTW